MVLRASSCNKKVLVLAIHKYLIALLKKKVNLNSLPYYLSLLGTSPIRLETVCLHPSPWLDNGKDKSRSVCLDLVLRRSLFFTDMEP